uniref:CSON010314 protein n=1 Tax=Culicoides sonorensis TaxID=179676 RepID=A0A336M451_CULSO
MGEEEFCITELEDCEPTPEELDAIYTTLDKGGFIELQWKCPGKRAPSPIRKEEVKPIETPEQKAKAAKEMEFDFMDDVALPTMRQRTQTPKTGNKKKTTNFAGVLDQMKKHGRFSVNNTPTSTPTASSAQPTSATSNTPSNSGTTTTTTTTASTS